MKTLATQNRKNISRLSAIILMSASALFLNSCQKDDMLAPRPQAGESYNRSEVSRTANVNTSQVINANLLSASNKENSSAAVFTMLTIDHSSAQTSQPSYKIEVKSDGSVLFTGRKNVAAMGERKFMISKETLIAIRNMYIDAKFNLLESLPFTFDMAIVTTAFLPKDNVELAVKIDYNGVDASRVIELRKAAENMLKISKYLNERSNINNLEENMAQQFN